MPVCAPRGCGCLLTGSAVQGGSGEVGAPYVIEAGGVTLVTSLTHPASPFQGQVIYETDTGQAYIYVSSTWEPTTTLGLVTMAEVTANQATITTQVDLTDLSVTWTAHASRYYRVSWHVPALSDTPGDNIRVVLADSGGQISFSSVTAAGASCTNTGFHVDSGLSGSITRKLQMVRANGTGTITMTAAATIPAQLIVEDIGLV